VLLLAGGEHGPAHVQAGGEWQVDYVDLGVVEDGLIGAVHLGAGRKSVSGGEGAGLVEGAAPDGVQGGIRRERDGAGDLARNLGAADEAETDFGGFRHLESWSVEQTEEDERVLERGSGVSDYTDLFSG